MTVDFEQEIDNLPSVIPHSREAEEAVVGAVLINPFAFFDIAAFLKADDFYIHRNKYIWKAFHRLYDKRVPIDLLTVCEELEKTSELSDVGGAAYLTSLINQVPSSLNAESYGRIVEAHSIRRKLIAFANDIATKAYQLEKPIFESFNGIKDQLEVIENNFSVEEAFQPVVQVMGDVYDEINERAKNPVEVWGIPTGLRKLDSETGGQQEGELTFLAGEPGVGKTWLALSMAYEMSKLCPGGFLSMELKRTSIGRRIVSGVSSVTVKAMRTGKVEEREWPFLVHAIEEAGNLPLYLDYNSYTTTQLQRVIRQAKNKYGFRFLIVDYAMLFLDEGKDDTERTGIVSRNLKRLARDLDLAVTCIHSVTKVGMDKDEGDPAKSYMRGSGQQIHDADNIFFLTKYHQTDELDGFLREDERKRMTTLWCKKGRELEDSSFVIHMVRKGRSPFFQEYDRKTSQMIRNIDPPEPPRDYTDI